MKRIVLISIFYLLALTVCTVATASMALNACIINNECDIIHTLALALSISGIYFCGKVSKMLEEEYKLYKAEKFLEGYKKDDKD